MGAEYFFNVNNNLNKIRVKIDLPNSLKHSHSTMSSVNITHSQQTF